MLWALKCLQELVFVMVIAPSILNPIWSWIIDNLVKDPKWGHAAHGYEQIDDLKGHGKGYGSAQDSS